MSARAGRRNGTKRVQSRHLPDEGNASKRWPDRTTASENRLTRILAEWRRLVLELAPPDELIAALREGLESTGLTWPGGGWQAWHCIKHVGASKRNERAFFSRHGKTSRMIG